MTDPHGQRRKARRCYQRFSTSDLWRVAYLAGRRRSGVEIAVAMGWVDMHGHPNTKRVYNAISQMGIDLAARNADQVAFPVVIARNAYESIERLAGEAGQDPEAVASTLIENSLAKTDIAKAIFNLERE